MAVPVQPAEASVDPADPAWLSQQLGRKVESVSVEDMSKAGGLNASMVRLVVSFGGASPRSSYVAKRTRAGAEEQSKSLGLPREALFYRELAAALPEGICDLAKVLYANGDMETGESTIVMEDLSDAVQSGYFFGPYSPLNWGKDLELLTAGWELQQGQVIAMAFAAASRLHAAFWHREDLKGKGWLRGAEWLSGDGQESWCEWQARAANSWAKVKDELHTGVAPVRWHTDVVACLDAAFGKVSWTEFQAELQARPWTLVHGDFHPGNMMVRPGGTIALLDYEQVGLGSGPQDLGQYMISHCEPAARAELERAAVRQYYDLLCAANAEVPASMSWEACWSEYKVGGLARWLWFLPYLAQMCPPEMSQYFHDQVLAFIQCHGFDASSVPMPRV